MKKGNHLKLIIVFICMFVIFVPNNTFAMQNMEQKIDDYITDHEQTLAGLATVIIHNDEIITKVHGHASIEQNLKVDDETVFEWGSTSKLLIWISVMQLVEEGRLDLATDIRNYVPDDFQYPNKYKEPITMFHLMNHTAGFDESFTDLMVLDLDELPSLREALEQTDVRQEFVPGEIVAYSNYGAALAAFIVEEISGLDYREYLNKHIFAPLRMKHTAIDPEQNDNEWVKEQRKKIQGYTVDRELIFPNNYKIPLYPAGSVVGTANDLASLINALLSDDGAPLFDNKGTIKSFFEPSLYYPETDIPRIAHGLFALPAEAEVYGHGGNTIAFSSSLYIDRENKTGVVVLTNQANEDNFSVGIPELIFGSPEINEAKNVEDASVWEGMYQPARSPYHGFSKIYGLLNRSSVKAEDTYDLVMNNLHYKQKQPGVYFTEDDFSLYSLDTYATHPTYEKVLSSAYGDLIPVPMYRHVAELTLLIAGVAGGIFSFIYIVLFIMKKVRGRKVNTPNAIQHGLNVIAVANIWWIIYSTLEMTTYEALRIHFLINILYVVATAGLSGYQIFRRKRVSYSGKQNIVSWMTIATALIICVNVVYWEFYY